MAEKKIERTSTEKKFVCHLSGKSVQPHSPTRDHEQQELRPTRVTRVISK